MRKPIKAIFLDVGGVLLTDGWDHHARKRAARKFNLDFSDMEHRHELNVGAFELGKQTLKEYLDGVVFHKNRSFTQNQFWKFMTEQSQPYPEMIELIRKLKNKYNLKIVVVSNESRDLNFYRTQTFKLDTFVDFFVSSCFVHFSKPDKDIFRTALDEALIPANQVVYIEDHPEFVQVAESMGIVGLCHKNYRSTRDKLKRFGLGLADSTSSSKPQRRKSKNEVKLTHPLA
jgi:putative hydrolase of the HAD superfamily